MRLNVALVAPSRLTCTAFTSSAFRRSQFSRLRKWPLVSIFNWPLRLQTNSTISKKRGWTMGSPPENERYGTSSSIACSSTENTCASSSSSGNALPGPLSSMQCRHARLHSFVICQAMYSGAARSSDDPGVAAPAAAVGGSAATAVAVTFASILDQSLLPEEPQERRHFAADRTGAVVEAV